MQRSESKDESRPISGRNGAEGSLDTPIDLTKNDDDPQGDRHIINVQ